MIFINKSAKKFYDYFEENFNNDYELLGNYEKSKRKIKIFHRTCNTIYEATPDTVYKGCKCPTCGNKSHGSYHKKNTKLFKEEVMKLVGEDYEVLGEYVDSQTNILIRHNSKLCNFHEYSVRPNNFTSKGRRCPICSLLLKGPKISKSRGWDHCRLIKEFSKQSDSNDYEFLSEYTKYDSKLDIKHITCGNIYKVSPSMLLRGRRCPICNNSSNGELRIVEYLKKRNINFIKEFTFYDCISPTSGHRLLFDFAIFDDKNNIKLLIEYDGKQHFETSGFYTQEKLDKLVIHDNIKNNYCTDNNYKLIRIHYKKLKQIESILDDLFSSTTIEK